MVLGAHSQTKQLVPLPWLTEVVQDLVQNQELVRIKKLLIYTCTHTWESDLEQVQAADLQNLLQLLLGIAPTLERLQWLLHSVASSLNKAAEYTLIANIILEPIKKWYPADEQPGERQHTDLLSTPANYQAIAERLHQDPEEYRIRKLLLLSCKNVWMSDRHQLAQLDLVALIQELHILAPSLEDLRLILENRIQKLSKSEAYRLIMERLIQALSTIYLIHADTQLLSDLDIEATKLKNQSLNQSKQPAEESIAVKARSKSSVRMTLSLSSSELFDLRLQIIRYANPFRVKILLFSLLHEPFNQTTEHYLMLKNYDLDELLRTLLQTYKLFDELKSNLSNTVKQLDESEEYRRVVEVVLQASQSFYDQRSLTSTPQETCEQITNLVKTMNNNSALTGPDLS